MRYSIILLWLVLIHLLNSCASDQITAVPPQATARPVATLRPTQPITPSPIPGPATDAPDTGWITGSSGIELRKLRVNLDNSTANISIVRLDPAQVQLHVGYSPDEPHLLSGWIERTRPLLVVNGGFFDQEFKTTALLISEGVPSGTSYEGFGGMLTVAPSGEVDIQALRDQPYDPAQPLEQAMQSFPMLVFPGGAAPGVEWNNERDRRTAIAIDGEGRLLVIAASQPSFTLNEFATWLLESDLAIDRALNLDGGASTGMYVDAGAAQELIEPFGRLPIVLFALER